MFIVIIAMFFRAFRGAQSTEHRAFLIILMGNGFFKLFFSGSYLIEEMFFYVVGLCAAMIRQAKHTRYG